jgi:hypothetical protein
MLGKTVKFLWQILAATTHATMDIVQSIKMVLPAYAKVDLPVRDVNMKQVYV